jgi:ankyrin repeat protein
MALVEDRPPADLMGRVPLHYAALFGDLHRAEELIAEGADIQIGDHDGQTPLHYAAQGGSVSVAELLLTHGAHVDAEDVDGNTPLWNATLRTRGDGPIVQLLMGRGADPHHANHEGRTAVQLSIALGGADLALRSVH